MGTQQILLIVLSVIIVGVAIFFGITMFRNQAYNSNQTAITSEVQRYAARVIEYYKKPVSLAGSGQGTVTPTQALVSTALGFDATTYKQSSDNGVFKVTAANGTSVTIEGIGKELRNSVYPKVSCVITLATSAIASTPGTSTTADFAE